MHAATAPLITEPTPSPRETATRVMEELLQHRRVPGAPTCDTRCPSCHAPHLAKVEQAVRNNEPITLVLPAFPGKSPNPAKVLGTLPDLGERHSLEFLHQLCLRLSEIHAPGARVVLCSDGRVFSDVVGMREEDVTAYQHEISALLKELNLHTITTFNLDDVFEGSTFGEMRAFLMGRYGIPLEALQEKVRRGKDAQDREAADALRMYLGITRFLVEDASHPGQSRSRTQIQKDCKARAYEVIRRSNAWSALIASLFPHAVRLSIHPQTCGAEKLGIKLGEAESWMTPWHGVAVEIGGRVVLLKRSQAEALGARVVHTNGRPSHFTLTERRSAPRA